MPSYTLSDLRREYAAYVAEMAEADAIRLAPRCNVPARREREAAAQREEARAEETRHWNSVTLPRLGASYRPVDRWLFTSRLSLRQQDYTKKIREGSGTIMSSGIVGRHRRDNYYTFSLGASFMLTKNASINGNFLYSFDDSTIPEYEYDRWRATLGITLRY